MTGMFCAVLMLCPLYQMGLAGWTGTGGWVWPLCSVLHFVSLTFCTILLVSVYFLLYLLFLCHSSKLFLSLPMGFCFFLSIFLPIPLESEAERQCVRSCMELSYPLWLNHDTIPLKYLPTFLTLRCQPSCLHCLSSLTSSQMLSALLLMLY